MVYCIYNGILYSHNKLGNSSIYNNMDGPCGNHAKWSTLDRKKKNTVWSHLYAESQKIKLIETKDKSVVTRGGGSGRGWAKWVKVVKGDKIAVIRWISSGDVMHSMVTVVNITVLYILKLLRE